MPMRGSPGASSCTPGCVATHSINCETSFASTFGLSTSASPPDAPKPRGSQVSTEYPARCSALMSTPPNAAPELPVWSVSPDAPHPGPIRTTGAGWEGVAPATGNQCARIGVPSKEMIVQSEGVPGSCVADTGLATGRWHAGATHEAVAALVVTEGDDEHAARNAAPMATP